MLKRTVIWTVVATMLVTGCAAPGGGAGGGGSSQPAGGSTQGQQQSGDPDQVCSPAVVGLIGGLACGALAGGKNRLRAAAACAAAAVVGCYMLNSYKAKQTKTAQQVDQEYQRTNGALPPEPKLVNYRTAVNPNGVVQRGAKVEVSSQLAVTSGRQARPVKVEEEIKVVDATGEVWGKPTRKEANAGSNGQAGEFATSFRIPVTEGFQQGVYQLHKTVYINDRAVHEDRSGKFQVVMGEDGVKVAQWVAQ